MVNSRRAWLMFGVGLLAYVVSVTQRTSMSVAALQATERFEVTAAALSTLAVAQLAVYALMQVPAGVLLDRLGPRAVLTAGAALMVAGQLTLSVSPTIGVAVVGRILVGAGDAATFICVLRLLGMWFSPSRLPILTQIVGVVGLGGQILSSYPLFAILHTWGWTPAYVSAAALSVVVLILVPLIVRSGPYDTLRAATSWGDSYATVREALSRPGTQLGFWTHFVSAGSTNMFSLLWGFPFLSIGLGYGPSAAAGLLTLSMVTSAVVGPLLGIATARYPLRRTNMVLAVVGLMAISWAVVLAWPGVPPLGFIIALIVVTSAGGSASLIGLDLARTFNDSKAHGSATGFANVGGFTAAFSMMFLIGVALDLIDAAHGGTGVPQQLYSLEAFRLAFLIQYVVVGAGVIFLLGARRRTRARLRADEGIEIDPLWVSLRDAWRQRRA